MAAALEHLATSVDIAGDNLRYLRGAAEDGLQEWALGHSTLFPQTGNLYPIPQSLR
ncbi:MAG: hypothetical protein HPY83_10715 [Anaerolineae bacterium]|nr:hypothetical protein [Anaerolineae bacterium]